MPAEGCRRVPQHDNRNGDANLHVHKVLLNRAVRDDHATSGDVKWAHVIVPAIRGGATVMDDVFGDDDSDESN